MPFSTKSTAAANSSVDRSVVSGSSYLHEIDGVRGIALTLVVLFHVFGDGRVSGGVDVFLVISAFFLTRKLWKRFGGDYQQQFDESNLSWLNRHFKRVFSRLAPSAVVVVAAILAATYFWAPKSQHLQITGEAIASLLYFENWELINSQLTYEAAGPESSPFQNFWSLSMQGQFFLVWPFIFWLLFTLTARSLRFKKQIFTTSIALLTAGSFVYAQYLVQFEQQVAYFNTYARFWELGIGALAAFLPGSFLNNRLVREVSIWSGLAMIGSSGFLFDGATLFPGIQTLWPVLGTALVLFGATRQAAPGLSARLLSTAAVAALTRISYQLFLWHWPLLVFYLMVRDRERIGLLGGLFVIFASVVLAILTEKLVRGMVVSGNRDAAKVKTWPAVMAPFAIILVLAVIWNSAVQRSEAEALQELSELEAQYAGAGALTDPEAADQFGQNVDFVPGLDIAAKDRPSFYGRGCHQKTGDEPGTEEVLVCDLDNYGNNKTVVLTGGSYAAQWYPAIQNIAKERGWRLLVIEKSGCRLTTESTVRACREWNEAVIDVISSYRPDAVFTLATVVYYQKLEDFHRGMINQISALDARGIKVFGLRGTPKFVFDVPECLEKSDLDQDLCSRPRDELYPADRQYPDELIGLSNFRLLDLTDAICEETICRPVVGNVLVYRDRGHMTATYVQTLTEPLLAAITKADADFIAN